MLSVSLFAIFVSMVIFSVCHTDQVMDGNDAEEIVFLPSIYGFDLRVAWVCVTMVPLL